MLISNKVRISRIIEGSWTYFLIDFLTCSVTYALSEYFNIINIPIPALLPTILGTALAFFIGFNNNQAYDRWWEARKIWGGLVNDSRSWARQLLFLKKTTEEIKGEDRNFIEILVRRHIGFVYALNRGLRKSSETDYLNFLNDDDFEYLRHESNKANAVLNLQTRDLNEWYQKGKVDGFQFMQLNQMLINFCDQMGKSERIANTVFPTTYNYYTRVFVWIFIVCSTLVTAESIGIWSVVFGTLIGYVFLTIHKIGVSLLNPFEILPTGIPLNLISRTIEINLLEMIRAKNVPGQVESVNEEYVL
ncbi:bestrophin family protein [Zunongwangia sp. HRR-M8]|uniref:bestrophin family protein n=1 Tax=Zunongwangia sp. HRR-M8 TaxID=3015170 RepID=UPI0022DDB1A3|nr:bestrophin family ion channel [Zunongwangia sp. HRR-M8]WBL23150.1 bestrophin family ion channel [Zunongwangia sp. HRR-M8]